MLNEQISELLRVQNSEYLPEGHEKCILGVCERTDQLPVIAYDKHKLLRLLMDDDMTAAEAEQYWEENCVSTDYGTQTPCYIELNNTESDEAEERYLKASRAVSIMTGGTPPAFSHTGASILVTYLQETGEFDELESRDIMRLWDEYASVIEAADAFGFKPGESAVEAHTDADTLSCMALEWLRERVLVIEFDNGVLVRSWK